MNHTREASLHTAGSRGNWGSGSLGTSEIIWTVNAGWRVEPWSTCPKSHVISLSLRGQGPCSVLLQWCPQGLAGWMNTWMSSKMLLLDCETRYCKAWLQLLLEKEDQEGQVREGTPCLHNVAGCWTAAQSPKVTLIWALYRYRKWGGNTSEPKASLFSGPCIWSSASQCPTRILLWGIWIVSAPVSRLPPS